MPEEESDKARALESASKRGYIDRIELAMELKGDKSLKIPKSVMVRAEATLASLEKEGLLVTDNEGWHIPAGDDAQSAHDTVERLVGDVDPSEFEGGAELAEKLRRIRARKLVGYGPDGMIYLSR